VRGNSRQIRKAAEMIDRATRPLLYIGGGAVSAGASDLVMQLATKASIPVFTTLLGKGGFPDSHPLCLGMAGMHGTAYANYAINEADLIVAIGARFDDRITGDVSKWAPQAEFVHIDVDPAEIGKVVNPVVPIVGDCRAVLEELVERVHQEEPDLWNARCDELKREYPLTCPAPSGALKPQYVIQRLSEHTHGEAIAVTDVGQHQMWAAQTWPVRHPRRFLTSGGLGTMGFGVPAALGAALAHPGTPVVSLSGDGSLLMNIQELATIAEQGLDVKICVFNNGSLGLVRQQQELFYEKRYVATRFTARPDFAAIARGFGLRACTIPLPHDHEALTAALRAPGPALLDIEILGTENVLPMVPPGKGNTEALWA
jgi:acetolactate synthase-1/2/3 large subunit